MAAKADAAKPKTEPTLRILGVDPGTRIAGYGLIEIRDRKPVLLACGELRLEKLSPAAAGRLSRLFHRLHGLILEFKPHVLAIEAPFYARNVQTTLKLGRAQGVAIAAALASGLEVSEYAPRKVKKAVTGRGDASKEQVAAMVLRMLPELAQRPEAQAPDATDALAVALCHQIQQGATFAVKKAGKGWSAFLNDNPDRILNR